MSEDKRCKKNGAHERIGHSPGSGLCKSIDAKLDLLDSAIRDRLCLVKGHQHGATHCRTCEKRTPSLDWLLNEVESKDKQIQALNERLARMAEFIKMMRAQLTTYQLGLIDECSEELDRYDPDWFKARIREAEKKGKEYILVKLRDGVLSSALGDEFEFEYDESRQPKEAREKTHE